MPFTYEVSMCVFSVVEFFRELDEIDNIGIRDFPTLEQKKIQQQKVISRLDWT